MTKPEYETKKRECWEEFCQHIVDEEEAFYNMFDRAYALGRQEKEAEKSKRMCLRDKSKACNKCHECDIQTDEWYSMSR